MQLRGEFLVIVWNRAACSSFVTPDDKCLEERAIELYTEVSVNP